MNDSLCASAIFQSLYVRTWNFMYVHEVSCTYIKLHVRTQNSTYVHRVSCTYMKLYVRTWSAVHVRTWSFMYVHEVKKIFSCPLRGSVVWTVVTAVCICVYWVVSHGPRGSAAHTQNAVQQLAANAATCSPACKQASCMQTGSNS